MTHDMSLSERAQRRTAELDVRRRELLRQSHESPRPPLAELGAVIVLTVAVFLLAAQWGLYPTGQEPQTNGLWSLGFAIVTAAAALRILLGQPGRHPAAVVLLLGSGVGLLLRATLAGHALAATAIAEGVCGALVLVGGLMALTSPATSTGQRPGRRKG